MTLHPSAPCLSLYSLCWSKNKEDRLPPGPRVELVDTSHLSQGKGRSKALVFIQRTATLSSGDVPTALNPTIYCSLRHRFFGGDSVGKFMFMDF